MSGPIGGNEGGTRRAFLQGTGAIAGGAMLAGGTLATGGQVAPAGKSQPAEAPPGAAHGSSPSHIRATAPASVHLSHLGPLRDLGGTWIGRGFNLISLPDFDNPPPAGPQAFRLKLNSTVEVLEFSQIGGPVPNRGSKGQDDITIFGVTYLQRVTDATTNGALHIEPGLWLNVPASVVPPQPATVVRQGSIPHGTSVLAQGAAIPPFAGGPRIETADPTPFTSTGPITNPAYLLPFTTAVVPPGAQPSYVKNPNQALLDAIAAQTIVRTQVLDISTTASTASSQGGGLLNIPFLVQNANVTQFKATFWIESVRQADGTEFMQLQYTQTVILNFIGINWPHISVATLVKQ